MKYGHYIFLHFSQMILERDNAKKAKLNASASNVSKKTSSSTSATKSFSPQKLTIKITSNQPDIVQSQVCVVL